MKCEEARELITALTDNQLSQPDRTAIENHLADCPQCRLVLRQEQTLKGAVHAAGLTISAPVGLREKILSDAVGFSQSTESLKKWTRKGHFWPLQPWMRPALALALLLVLALPVFYLLDHRSQPVSLAAVETYETFLRGDLPTIKAKSTEEMKEALARAVGGSFNPMGYDLSMIKVEPVAGAVREIEGRKILVTLYRGQGPSLICYTFLGTDKDAPMNAAVFFDPAKNMNFYAFSHGSINAVLHREGNVICILASEMPMQDLLALAQSKARPS